MASTHRAVSTLLHMVTRPPGRDQAKTVEEPRRAKAARRKRDARGGKPNPLFHRHFLEERIAEIVLQID
jgi:hypothetical protein